MSRRASALANQCVELAATWIDGNRNDVRMALTTGRSRARSIALAVGIMRTLHYGYGESHAADFANTITEPFGGLS